MEALSSLASEAAVTLEVEQPLGLEIQKLTAKMQASAELWCWFRQCWCVPTRGRRSGSVGVCQLGDEAGDLSGS